MSMMSMKDTTDRGETHIRSVGFLDECEDALSVIRTAKLRAAYEVQATMERLRDVLRDALRPRKRRRPSRPTRASKERRLDAKKRKGDKKRERRRKDW